MKHTIGGIVLQNPVMNGAYIGSKNVKDITALINSDASAVVVGSITVEPRQKNPGPGYWKHKEGFYSLNSYGMPNGGIAYFKTELPKIITAAHAKGKPVIANIAGFSDAEFLQLIALAERSGADIVELNLGCPNVWSEGRQKTILSYQPKLVKRLLDKIAKAQPSVKLSVKISPLPPDILREIAKVISESKIITAVVATNSFPNALVSTGTQIDNERDFAGMSGRALKPISLGVVQQLHALLPNSIEIIGCGGITSKNDVADFLKAGASAVQIATILVDEGLGAFSRLVS